MSITISKIVNLPQAALKFLVREDLDDETRQDFKTNGGVFSDSDYAWLSNGPRLEVINTKTGNKVGAWTFGWVLKDPNIEVVCVDEIQRPYKRPPLLAVGVDCEFNGGMICIFDFVISKVIRAIQFKDKITKLHVIDAGHDVFTLPGPLRNFDGIIAVGLEGGDVFLVDICRQTCDEALTVGGLSEIRDEVCPCQLNVITFKDISRIEFHKELAVRNSQHLAIHLNVIFDKSTKHFILKGPKGDDRIHVNKEEVAVSALYYCPQLGSLLIGFNFGALQLYNLMNLELVYTSPVCDEHIPISHFAIQEPADDPRAFCYVWAVYSASEQYSTYLPLAVMYAFCYHTKEYHEGYGVLYQDFNTAGVHFQMELGIDKDDKRSRKPKGGYCLKLNSITQGSANKGSPTCDANEDNLTLCILAWNVWYNSKEIDTFIIIFDLDQWYKEQMPGVPDAKYSSTYMIQMPISGLIKSATNNSLPVIDIKIDQNSIQQYSGAQRLEEHFYPNSLSFAMSCLRENDVVHLRNYGVQKALLVQIESAGPFCLVEPAEVYQEIVGLGLAPLFIDLPVNMPVTTNQQREIILGAALENHLIGWLCKCASEWANGSYLSTGCSLDFLITWAFQRAVTLKANCDNFCVPLFDYSEARPDNNTISSFNRCTRQLNNLCSLYGFILRKLRMFLSNQELVGEQYKSLQNVSVYFEVLQWLLNVGLLPECPLTAYPRSDDLERIGAPYPAEMLIDFYNHRRAILKIANEENFSSSASVLFIDNLIERECGGKTLQEQWQSDGGNGLYPPPSLQALLRTYLIDNVELFYKHSVIIYVFLDLAMTLDQDRYKPVITYLIKFPAVFKVRPSLIKITQAFWQLDHGDYNTAMGLLLDPLVLKEDLTHWHHKVALRSLILQKQHNFALLYIQVRQPPPIDDEDILTGISLYVANNMLDEAFNFEKKFVHHSDGEKFLVHLFNVLQECKKSDKLRSLIYRSLSSPDEDVFLKYLVKSNNSTADDLHVYYHILRSQYLEAFENHERTLPNNIESMGLKGQEQAVPRDKIVHCLKQLLPVVHRKLLDLCHKEKTNVWREVAKPTPMSVFVYNSNENVQYKSTLIGAALAKAKQTFNDTISDKFKVDSEGTPFLRAPRIGSSPKGSPVLVVIPKVVAVEKAGDEISTPPSAKRMKLSPRVKSTPMSASVPSKLETPIVKRKLAKVHTSTEEKATPHGILKVKTPKKNEGEFEDDFKAFEKLEYTPVTSKKPGLGLSSRKSLVKASPIVRFEGVQNSSSSTLSTSRNTSDQRLSAASSKNTSTEEEIFYSPETSLEDKEAQLNGIDESEVNETLLSKNGEEIIEKQSNKEKETAVAENERSVSPTFSPKGRRSYKRSLALTTPVRSSPRLSKSATSIKDTPSPRKGSRYVEESSSTSMSEISYSDIKELASSNKSSLNSTESKSVSSENNVSKSPVLPKLRPRKSLCRKVLETNTVRMLVAPLDSPKSRNSKNLENEEVRSEETIETVQLESTIKYDDGEESRKSSFVKKHNLTTSFVESDFDTSDDFSIDFEVAEEPKILSSSMMRYLNKSKDVGKTDNETEEEKESVSFVETQNNIEKSNEITENSKFEAVSKNEKESVSFEETQNNIEELNEESERSTDKVTENSKLQPATNTEPQEKPINLDASIVSISDQSTASVFDSSGNYTFESVSNRTFGPKFSESMIRCINNRYDNTKEASKTEETPKNDDVEEMEVDDDVSSIEENCDEVEAEKEQNEEPSEDKQKEKEKEDTEPSDNRPQDPEMNVFEISDDLNLDDGLVMEQEVTLEENDTYYDQQNTFENFIEENITPVSTNLEKNVFNDGVSSEEASSSDRDQQEDSEIQVGEKTEAVASPDEVIEIGSSSEEDEEKNKDESSEYSSENSENSYEETDEEKLEVSYEKNIYDTEGDYSSESSEEERRSSEESEETKAGELFHGAILLVDDDQKKDKNSKSPDVEIVDDKIEEREGEESEDEGKNEERITEPQEEQSEDERKNEKRVKEQQEEQSEDERKNEERITEQQEQQSEDEGKNEETVTEQQKKQFKPKIFDEFDSSFTDKSEKGESPQIGKEKYETTYNQTLMKCDLFYGDILMDEEEKDKNEKENKEEKESDNKTDESSKDNEKVESDKETNKDLDENRKEAEDKSKESNVFVEIEQEKLENKTEKITSVQGEETSKIQSEEKALEAKIFAEYDSIIEEPEQETSSKIVSERYETTCNKTQMQCGLFYGDIVMNEEDNEKDDTSQDGKAVDVNINEVEEDSGKTESEEKVEEKQKDLPETNVQETISLEEQQTPLENKEENLKQEDAAEVQPVSKKISGKENKEIDVEMKNEEVTETVALRTRSSSVSSSKSEKTTRKNKQRVTEEEVVTPRRSTRRKRSTSVENTEKPDEKPETPTKPARTLRLRRGSTEEKSTPVLTMRKRSSSVDEAVLSSQKETEFLNEESKDRSQRAASVSRLPKIPEEGDDTPESKPKRAKSVLENYSMTRRMTRRQMNLLQKTVGNLDPTVILERLPLEGTPDPEDKKVLETSPSPSNSTASSPQKPKRRLRSASQTSEEGSQRAKSITPVRSLRKGSRKASTENRSNVSEKGTLKMESGRDSEERSVGEARITRSRARSASFSSVNSEDSTTSGNQKVVTRKQKLASQSHLPEIKEESTEKAEVPKKRTRKSSSHK